MECVSFNFPVVLPWIVLSENFVARCSLLLLLLQCVCTVAIGSIFFRYRCCHCCCLFQVGFPSFLMCCCCCEHMCECGPRARIFVCHGVVHLMNLTKFKYTYKHILSLSFLLLSSLCEHFLSPYLFEMLRLLFGCCCSRNIYHHSIGH